MRSADTELICAGSLVVEEVGDDTSPSALGELFAGLNLVFLVGAAANAGLAERANRNAKERQSFVTVLMNVPYRFIVFPIMQASIAFTKVFALGLADGELHFSSGERRSTHRPVGDISAEEFRG